MSHEKIKDGFVIANAKKERDDENELLLSGSVYIYSDIVLFRYNVFRLKFTAQKKNKNQGREFHTKSVNFNESYFHIFNLLFTIYQNVI